MVYIVCIRTCTDHSHRITYVGRLSHTKSEQEIASSHCCLHPSATHTRIDMCILCMKYWLLHCTRCIHSVRRATDKNDMRIQRAAVLVSLSLCLVYVWLCERLCMYECVRHIINHTETMTFPLVRSAHFLLHGILLFGIVRYTVHPNSTASFHYPTAKQPTCHTPNAPAEAVHVCKLLARPTQQQNATTPVVSLCVCVCISTSIRALSPMVAHKEANDTGDTLPQ